MPNFVTDTLAKVDSTLLSYTSNAFANLASANASSLRLMLILYVAVFGILVWVRRAARKKAIQGMFGG